MNASCAMEQKVDAHFALAIGPADEMALRAHLSGCERCRTRYERHLLLAKLDPTAPSAEVRLGAALGIAKPKPKWINLAMPAVALALAASLMLVVHVHHADSEFAARGAPLATHAAELRIFRVEKGTSVPVHDRISRNDALAFAYLNRTGKTRLMVFAVDEHHHVYWYYPCWSDASKDPVAVPIAASNAIRELPDAVSQPLDGQHLAVYALFTDASLGVKEVEARLRASPAGASKLEGTLVERKLEVAR